MDVRADLKTNNLPQMWYGSIFIPLITFRPREQFQGGTMQLNCYRLVTRQKN
jgi:hypothetical protein